MSDDSYSSSDESVKGNNLKSVVVVSQQPQKRKREDSSDEEELKRRREARKERHEAQQQERRRREAEGPRERPEDRRDSDGERYRRSRVDRREREEGSGRKEAEKKEDEENQDPEKKDGEEDEDAAYWKKKRKVHDDVMTRTGGAYIPPARLKQMQAGVEKNSQQFQRLAWEALKKSINGLVNKVNASNLEQIVKELFQENLVRGRGTLIRSVMTAQAASPLYTNVYAALMSVINSQFPQIGELLLRRLVIQFKKAFRRNEKSLCLSSVIFIAHLVNQQVAHEIIALEILFLLLNNPTDDSVEVAVGFLKESGAKLQEVSNKAVVGVFERLRNVLHEAQIEKRTQYMIEVMFAVRKDGFKDYPSLIPELDKIEEDDQITHTVRLEDATDPEDGLNVFKFDPEYETNEEKYKMLREKILGSESSDEKESGSEESEDEEEEENKESEQITDMTETNLVGFRRTVYLTIQSSLDFEECCHKLLKMEIKPGWEYELASMMLDCCAQMRTYEKFFGLLAQRFCMLDRKYIEPFQRIFREQYETIHRLETNKLRNVGKFFGHLLYTDAISWEVLEIIKLNEDDTTSSSRIFLKVLFQELSEYMGLAKLNDRMCDQTLEGHFLGLKPRDNPRNLRFAINFFTSIGLGGLTDDMRAMLKVMPKQTKPQKTQESSESSDSSESDSSSSDSSSSSSSSSSDEKHKKQKKKSKKYDAAAIKKKLRKLELEEQEKMNKEKTQEEDDRRERRRDGGEARSGRNQREVGREEMDDRYNHGRYNRDAGDRHDDRQKEVGEGRRKKHREDDFDDRNNHGRNNHAADEHHDRHDDRDRSRRGREREVNDMDERERAQRGKERVDPNESRDKQARKRQHEDRGDARNDRKQLEFDNRRGRREEEEERAPRERDARHGRTERDARERRHEEQEEARAPQEKRDAHERRDRGRGSPTAERMDERGDRRNTHKDADQREKRKEYTDSRDRDDSRKNDHKRTERERSRDNRSTREERHNSTRSANVRSKIVAQQRRRKSSVNSTTSSSSSSDDEPQQAQRSTAMLPVADQIADSILRKVDKQKRSKAKTPSDSSSSSDSSDSSSSSSSSSDEETQPSKHTKSKTNSHRSEKSQSQKRQSRERQSHRENDSRSRRQTAEDRHRRRRDSS